MGEKNAGSEEPALKETRGNANVTSSFCRLS